MVNIDANPVLAYPQCLFEREYAAGVNCHSVSPFQLELLQFFQCVVADRTFSVSASVQCQVVGQHEHGVLAHLDV